MKKNNKVILGAANFSNKYGLKKKKLSKKKICSLFKTFNKYKINIVDTAQSYGNSEKIVGKLKKSGFVTCIGNLWPCPDSNWLRQINNE